jgi:Ca2+-binding RTX toxin-like protein
VKRLHHLIHKLRNSGQAPGGKRKASRRPLPLRFELLEDRTLPSSTITLSAGVLAYSAGASDTNNLTFSFNSATGVFLFIENGGVTINTSIPGATGSGSSDVTVPDSSVTSVQLNLLNAQNDILNLQSMNSADPVTFNGGAGNDTVNISSDAPSNSGDLLGVQNGVVTVSAASGANQLNVSESGSSSPDTLLVTSSQISSLVVPFSINYSGSFGGDINLSTPGANTTLTVQSAAANTVTNIVSNGATNVTVGNSGSVQAIAGTLNLENPPNFDTIVLDDSADSTARSVTISSLGTNPADSQGNSDPWGQISGLAPGVINFEYPDTTSLTVNAGGGNNTFHVQGTGTATEINTGAGNDTVTVGDASNTLTGIGGALSVNGQGGTDQLNLNDQGTGTSQNYSINSTGVTATTAAGSISYSGFSSLTLNGSTGSLDNYNVAPSAITTYTVNANGSSASLSVSLSGASNPKLTPTGPEAGTFTFGNRQNVSYAGIAVVNAAPASGTYDMIFDMATLGFQGGSGLDTIVAQLDSSGTNLQMLVGDNGGAPTLIFSGSAASVASLDVIGSSDNDLFEIAETSGGLPSFTGTALGSHSDGGSLPAGSLNPANIGINFDGGSGSNTLELSFLTSRNVADFSDNAGPANSENVSVAGAFTLSAENLRPNVFVGAGGTLIIDATANPMVTTLNFAAVGGGTNIVSDPLGEGFESATFSGFDSVEVLAGTGPHTVTLQSADGSAPPSPGHPLTAISLSGNNSFGTNTGPNTINAQMLPATISLSLLGAPGNDTFNVGSTSNTLGPIQGAVSVNGGGGTDTLNINDQGTAGAQTYTITSTSVAATSLAQTLTYSKIASLVLNGGTGANTYDVQSTDAGTTVNTGPGNDTVNVGSTSNTLAGILGQVNVNGGGGTDFLNVNDQGTAGNETYTITNTAVTATSAGAPIVYAGIANLTLNGGTGTNVYNVQSTSATTIVNTGTGTDVINVGSPGNTLAGILGPLTINGQGGPDALNINDQATIGVETYTVTNATVTANPPDTPITYAGINSLTLNGGSGPDTYNVQSTGTATIVNTGSGNDTVNVGSTANTLAGIAGSLTINGQGGTDLLNINDQGTLTGQTYTITNATVTATSAPATITYAGITNLVLNGAKGGNTILVRSTGPATTINAGIGNDTVNVGSTGNTLDGILGALSVNGQNGTNLLSVNDQGTASGESYTITNTTVTATSAGAPIHYTAIFTLTLNGAMGGNSITVQSTGNNTIVNAGAGSDTVNVGNPASTLADIQGPLTVNGQAGTNLLNINDQGTIAPTTYTVTNTTVTASSAGAAIQYTGISTLTLNGGRGDNTIGVQSTGPTTDINAGAGNDTVNVGSTSNTLATIMGVVNVNGQAGVNLLNINDQGTPGAQAYKITSTTVTATSSGAPINYAGISTLTLNGGSGSDTYNVQSTANATTVINTGPVNDNINVSSNAPFTGVLAGIAGNLIIHGAGFTAGNTTLTLHPNGTPVSNSQPAGNILNMSDTTSPTNNTYLLTGTVLTGSSLPGAILFDSIQTLVFNAGTGKDTITSTNNTVGNVTINGGSGADTISIDNTGPASNTVVNSGPNNDTIIVNGTGNAAFTQLNGGAGNDSFTMTQTGTGSVTEVNGVGGTNLTTIGTFLPLIQGLVAVHGGPGNDQLVVSDASDTVGRSGVLTSDTITGLGMPAGIDYDPIAFLKIVLGHGNNSFKTVNTHTGSTLIAGTTGNDYQSIMATSGPTSFVGGSGNDTFGFANAATLSGGTIDGGGGINMLNFETYTTSVSVNLSGSTGNFAIPTGPTVPLPAANSASNGLKQAITATGGVHNIQIVIGSTHNDLLVGGAGDFLQDQGGNDIMLGLGGNDTLIGGIGTDIIFGGGPGGNVIEGSLTLVGEHTDGNDLLVAQGNSNTVIGGWGNDTINSFGDNSILFGNRGNDPITATGNANTLMGGSGNDTITAVGLNNVLFGGGGTDRITADGPMNLHVRNGNVLFGGSLADLEADRTNPNFIAPEASVLTSNGSNGTNSGNLVLIDSCIEFRMGNMVINIEPLGGGFLGLANDPIFLTNPANGQQFGPSQFAGPNPPNMLTVIQGTFSVLQSRFKEPLVVPPPDPIQVADPALEAADPTHHHGQVALSILGSGEFRSSEINSYYLKYLGRPADQAGLNTWLRQLKAGATEQSVLTGILGSGEYFARSGNSNISFINALYHDLLGRLPGPSEINTWLGVLAHTNRSAVALSFLMSTEFRSGLIESWYMAYLGRAAESTDLNFWLAQMKQGLSQAAVQAAILGSAEYQSRVSSQFVSNPKVALIQGLYRDVLHRTAGSAEINYWLGLVSAF